MSRRQRAAFLMFAIACCTAAAQEPKPSGTVFLAPLKPAAPAQNAGVFVGINEFPDDAGISTLSYAVNDAVELAHAFVYDLKLIPVEKCFLCLGGKPTGEKSTGHLDQLRRDGAVLSDSATRVALLKALDSIEELSFDERSSLVVVGLSTHGIFDSGVPYVIPSDGLRSRLALTALPLTEVEESVGRTKAGHRLLLVDACQERVSAKSLGNRPETRSTMSAEFQKALQRPTGQAKLASCSPGEFSFENPGVRQGVFTQAFLTALRGKARPGTDNLVRLDSVIEATREEMGDWAKGSGRRQTVFFAGPETARQLPLAARADDLATLASQLKTRISARPNGFTHSLFDQLTSALSRLKPDVEQDREFLELTRDFAAGRVKELAFVPFLKERLATSPRPRPTPAPMKVAQGDVKLPRIFSDHMVLQADQPIPIWGQAGPGDPVAVTLAGNTVRGTADSSGRWLVKLPAMAASSQPTKLTTSARNTVTLNDVLIGEVWVCCGQSNMQWRVNASERGAEEIASATFPQIRLFEVSFPAGKVDTLTVTTIDGKIRTGLKIADTATTLSLRDANGVLHQIAKSDIEEQKTISPGPDTQPQVDFKNNEAWAACSPTTVGTFSAVGYFFGREVHRRRRVPVGLIAASRGGSMLDAWVPPSAMTDPAVKRLVADGSQSASTADFAKPSALYNTMLTPLVPYGIRGVVWYHGESGGLRVQQYGPLFAAMIRSWRKEWGQGEFPFLFVQIAPFNYTVTGPENVGALVREAQLKTLIVPNTAMVVTTDLGDPKDIHPKRKQEVGLRLSLAARRLAYGEDVVHSGPLFKSIQVSGNTITVTFDYASGLTSKGAKLVGFQIAGANRKFVEAAATIVGEQVVVSSPQVAAPVAVRYAFANVPDANLYNAAGLPASPFRTDDH